MTGPIEPAPEGVRLALQIQPRASRTELVGRYGNALKLRVAAPPINGAANLELVRFLAERLGVRRFQVEVIAGQHGRKKTVLIRGETIERVQRGLGLEPHRPQ